MSPILQKKFWMTSQLCRPLQLHFKNLILYLSLYIHRKIWKSFPPLLVNTPKAFKIATFVSTCYYNAVLN